MNKKEIKKEYKDLQKKQRQRLIDALSKRDPFEAVLAVQGANSINLTEKIDFIDKYIEENI